MCTGNPGDQAHGPAPEDGVKNYFLFLPKTYLAGAGTVLTLVLRGLPVSKAEFDPAQPVRTSAGEVTASPGVPGWFAATPRAW